MTPVRSVPDGIRPHAGGSLDPHLIIGRDELVAELRTRLHENVPILITDPRRMGKTCLLDRFVYCTEAPWVAVKVDYEGVGTIDEFLCRTIEALRGQERLRHRVMESVRGFVQNIEVGVGELRISTAFDDQSKARLLETLLQRIDERIDGDERVVLAMDEVPLAIQNIVNAEGAHAADGLLQTLRRLRQRSGSRIRWIVTGSVGFHHVLRLAATTEGAINDFESILCGPLDQRWAEELARKLLLGIEVSFSDETVDALVLASGRIPYLLHHLAGTLRGMNGPCTPAHVQTAWTEFVEDRDRSRAATHFLNRIGAYYGEHEADALRVLDTAATTDVDLTFDDIVSSVWGANADGATRDTARYIVDHLVDDHYLVGRGTYIEWRYAVLRELWVVRRRLGSA